MTDFEITLMRLYIRLSRHGLKASELAEKLSLDRKTVNRFLYSHKDEYEQDDYYRWTIISDHKKKSEEYDPVLAKLNNRINAKQSTIDDFNSIADWSYGETHTRSEAKEIYTTRDGNVIECDSKSELKMLHYLEDNDLILACGGQALCINYDSEFRENLDYHPDIVILTKDRHIAIIEVKSASAMDYHKNVEKYRALQAYCKEEGYEYMMVDPDNDYMTFEELRNMRVDSDLYEFFDAWNDEPDMHGSSKSFDKDDVNNWYNDFDCDYMSKNDFYLQVHSLVIYFHWYNYFQNGFKVFSKPIKMNRAHNRIIEIKEKNSD